MTRFYKLVDRRIVETDVLDWAHWFGSADRRVATAKVGDAVVSTVFLGIGWHMYETMIFRPGEGGKLFGRWSSWHYAEAGHAEAVAAERLRIALVDGPD